MYPEFSDGGYPLGAANDPNAPYNRVDEETELQVCGEIRVYFSTSVCTCDAVNTYEMDDDGEFVQETCTDKVDLKKEFLDQHMTPIQLIRYLKEEMAEKMKRDPSSRTACMGIIKECEIWEDEDDLCIEKN